MSTLPGAFKATSVIENSFNGDLVVGMTDQKTAFGAEIFDRFEHLHSFPIQRPLHALRSAPQLRYRNRARLVMLSSRPSQVRSEKRFVFSAENTYKPKIQTIVRTTVTHELQLGTGMEPFN